ncbi:hypothetical protein KALB_5792 [Kutzneria albida DSM 43870]|uniref:Cytochrome P450 n=2 Tax=Kutzneria TaxID=43356 RepID=W5WDC8_9PSEU|nr:hypothetical protein KALB_5792 [Kutzneria albida DSM 43870]
MTVSGIPEHCARLSMQSLMTDPYRILARFREQAPAVAVEHTGYRMWLVTRYEDVRRILADTSVIRDFVANQHRINTNSRVRPVSQAHLVDASRRSFFERDGADHRRLRGFVNDVFTPDRLAQLRVEVEQLVERLLDTLPVGEPVDLMTAYAYPIAMTVIGDLAGVPSQPRKNIPVWICEMITSPVISEIEHGANQLHAFSVEMAALKRAEPGQDLFTDLLQVRERELMTEDELTSIYLLFLVAGTEAASAIGNGLLTLLRHRDQLDELLATGDSFADAVEEILRFESPFRLMGPRLSTRPVALDGPTIPAGELILLSPGAANHDPLRFPNPDEFDVRRRPSGHLGFGHGPHHCLGYALGRLETTTALRQLFRRYPNTELVHSQRPADWRPGKFMRRLNTLAVILR